jgi:hypothetical protein
VKYGRLDRKTTLGEDRKTTLGERMQGSRAIDVRTALTFKVSDAVVQKVASSRMGNKFPNRWTERRI